MSGPRIDLPPDQQSSAFSAQHNPLLEYFFDALESARGIAVECADTTAATSLRMRLYRARDAAKASGNHAFNQLVLTIVGNELHIRKDAPRTVREL